MLMHLYTAGALLGGVEATKHLQHILRRLAAFVKAQFFEGRDAVPCEEVRNEMSTPCTIISEYRSAFLV
jgi:hypothetical protein